ncbi:MAG: hypothetical protein WAN65_01320 [Candidatus Sulfotelmatobacter sp.]
MKSTKQIILLASTLACLIVFATASFAATLVLPRGLAVDSKGNLWVANSGANNILVYNPSYVLQKAKTITAGISTPWGVAFDRWGNPWVANNGNNTVTEYLSGQLIPASTLTAGITSPQALAFDPMGDLWVQDDGVNMTVYVPNSAFGALQSWGQTINAGETLYGLAISAGGVATGSPNGAMVSPTGADFLFGGVNDYISVVQSTGFAIACDAAGRFYIANLDGSVEITAAAQGANGSGSLNTSNFLQLPFAPSGIAVDSAHGRVYFSNYNNSTISVYSTAGALLHTIQ